MTNPVQRLTEKAAMSARRAQAGAASCFAIFILIFAMLLTFVIGINWLMLVVDLLLTICAAVLFLKACETYGRIEPSSQQPEERQRYLHSQSLYIPGSMREARRRRRSQHD